MIAGNSEYKVGTRIKITHVSDKEDEVLVGLTGKLTHPFGMFPSNYVGVYLEQKGVVSYDICNLSKRDKFEIIE